MTRLRALSHAAPVILAIAISACGAEPVVGEADCAPTGESCLGIPCCAGLTCDPDNATCAPTEPARADAGTAPVTDAGAATDASSPASCSGEGEPCAGAACCPGLRCIAGRVCGAPNDAGALNAADSGSQGSPDAGGSSSDGGAPATPDAGTTAADAGAPDAGTCVDFRQDCSMTPCCAGLTCRGTDRGLECR